MAYNPIEELLPKAEFSVYRLVRLAATRAIELAEGKPRLIAHPSLDKETTIALEEIAAGKVETKRSFDTRVAKEKTRHKEKSK